MKRKIWLCVLTTVIVMALSACGKETSGASSQTAVNSGANESSVSASVSETSVSEIKTSAVISTDESQYEDPEGFTISFYTSGSDYLHVAIIRNKELSAENWFNDRYFTASIGFNLDFGFNFEAGDTDSFYLWVAGDTKNKYPGNSMGRYYPTYALRCGNYCCATYRVEGIADLIHAGDVFSFHAYETIYNDRVLGDTRTKVKTVEQISFEELDALENSESVALMPNLDFYDSCQKAHDVWCGTYDGDFLDLTPDPNKKLFTGRGDYWDSDTISGPIEMKMLDNGIIVMTVPFDKGYSEKYFAIESNENGHLVLTVCADIDYIATIMCGKDNKLQLIYEENTPYHEYQGISGGWWLVPKDRTIDYADFLEE